MEWDSVVDKLSSFGERAGKGLKRLFGSENERFLRTLEPVVSAVNAKEEWAKSLDRDAIQAEVRKYREQVVAGTATIDDFVAPMFAMTREASQRTMGMRHYDVQLVGGYVMHQGKIAEMMTGEGKTLMATLALCLNSLSGRTAYLVTVNDYLAKRDALWMKPIYEYMGLTVGSIQSEMDPWERKPVYDCDIVYGTNNEFGFDYLRDNMKTSPEQQVQKDLYFAIVDEVDSILIDESRTPLIISGQAEDSIGKYVEADKIARALQDEEHYEVKEKERSASLVEAGIVAAQDMLGVKSFYEPGFEDWPHYIENAIRAHSLYTLDKEYVVEEVQDQRTGQVASEVIIVDEFTGRKMAGRRWSDGLHQAVEVKEGLTPKQETQTMATITFQNYFRMFDKLSGMTGTAITEAGEFHKIYDLDVVCVPTNLPIARADHSDLVYRTEREKWNAICEEIEELNSAGQPILVGTASVESSEHVAKLLRERNVKHEVLNAKNHEREAHIIAMAGEKGAITVATNMAGRGTDIKLGGNFEYRLEAALEEAGLELGDEENLERIDAIREEVKSRCDVDETEVLSLGGLYVLGTERHEARRIDNQLRGRTGRQGNVGASRFFLSLEDPLMRIFYRDWTRNMMEKLGMTEGQAIESKMVSNAIARAQRKVEDRNMEIRKSLLEYDEVMDTQRKTIYGVRQEVLEGEGLKDKVLTMIEGCLERAVRVHADDAASLTEWCQRTFGIEIKGSSAELASDSEVHDMGPLFEEVKARYEEREAKWGDELARRIENYILLNAIDSRWKDHLKAIDALKIGIGLRSYGQEDPKTAYKKEGTDLFQDHLLPSIENEVASLILRIEVQQPEEPEAVEAEAPSAGAPESGLQPKGMGSSQAGAQPMQGSNAPQQLTPEQVELLKSRARKQVAQQAMNEPGLNASNAFDVMRRNKAMAQAQAAQQAKAEGKPAPAPARPAAPAGFEGVGRNDECPCGSGKKFKKCHGK